MAFKGEISFKTDDMGELEGPRENKTSLIYEFKHEVYLPFESEENMLQGMRKITPFEIVKSIDRITPILYNIVCNGVKCTEVLITLYRIAEQSGEEEPYFKYQLNDAKIVSVQNWMPPTYVPETESIGHLEKVKILARKFTWTYIDGGITHIEEAF